MSKTVAIAGAAALALAAAFWYLTAADEKAADEQQKRTRRRRLLAASQALREEKRDRRLGERGRSKRRGEALAERYGGGEAAAVMAARALRDAEAAGRARVRAAVDGHDRGGGDAAPELEVDLGWFASHHDGRGRRSICRQLADATGHARKSLRPLVLTLAGYEGEAAEALTKIGAGEWPVVRDARSTWQRRDARPRRVVYLTPDADEPLEGLEDGCTYVVGALVDRTVAKRATLHAAALRGCDVRRLPIREHKGALSHRGGARKVVLNIDVVLHCLMRLRDNGGDWADALVAALPDGKPTPPRLSVQAKRDLRRATKKERDRLLPASS